MPSIYSSISNCCNGSGGGGGVDVNDFLYSDDPLGSTPGQLVQKNPVPGDRGVEVSGYNVNDLDGFEQRISSNEDDITLQNAQIIAIQNEQVIQDDRLSVLENAPPDLPPTTQNHERLISDGSQWLPDSGATLLGENLNDIIGDSILVGKDLATDKERTILCGYDIDLSTATGENAIVLNTGSSPVSFSVDNKILLKTDAVSLALTEGNTDPKVLGSTNGNDYLPITFESMFNNNFNASAKGSYLYYNPDINGWDVGTGNVFLGSNVGLGTLTSFNTLIGVNSGSGGSYQNSTVVGVLSGAGANGRNNSIIGYNVANGSLVNDGVVIGSNITGSMDSNLVSVGFNQQGSLGRYGIRIGSDIIGDVGNSSLCINASTFKNDDVPQGAIHIEAGFSSIKLDEVSIIADKQPNTGTLYTLSSSNGSDYVPTDLQSLVTGASFSPSAVVAFRSTANTILQIPRATSGTTFNPMSFVTPVPYLDLSPAPEWSLLPNNVIQYTGNKTVPCQINVEMNVGRQNQQECDIAVRVLKNSQLLSTKLPYHGSLSRSPQGGMGSSCIYFSEINSIAPNDTFEIQIEYYDANANEILNVYSLQLSIWSLSAANLVTTNSMVIDSSAITALQTQINDLTNLVNQQQQLIDNHMI